MSTKEVSIFKAAAMAAKPQSEQALAEFEELLGAGYLQRLQLCTSNSEFCKDGSVPTNNYALVIKTRAKVLGVNVDVVPICFRPTAMLTGDEFLIIHDKESEKFQELVQLSNVKDSGAMFGPEFLVWVPSERCFASLFCGSKTARNMASDVFDNLGECCTFGSVKISGKKQSWFGMTCTVSKSPVLNQPTAEELAKAVEDFKNDTGVGEAADAATGSGREV